MQLRSPAELLIEFIFEFCVPYSAVLLNKGIVALKL